MSFKLKNLVPIRLRFALRNSALYWKYALRSGELITYSDRGKVLNIAPPVYLETKLKATPKIAIIRETGLAWSKELVNPKSFWLRYERFCKTNKIPYDFYDITKSNWIEEASKFDIFICHTPSTPAYQEMIESKIYFLEKIMGKSCFPSYHEVWQYESKVRTNYLYQYYDLPTIPTVITHNKEEALELVRNAEYPFITKTTIGASSTGVTLIKSKKQAIREVKKIFSTGLKTQFSYQKQKDYFYQQKFINDSTFDLRIMIVGNKAFGYYRYPQKGDFKASGSGIVDKRAIPFEALLLAIEVKRKLNSRQLGVDLLYSEKENQYYIIETSIFNQIDTPEQLLVNGVPGYYDISDLDHINFKEGRFWPQELMLKDLVLQWALKES